MHKGIRFGIVLILGLFLIVIRIFEEQLFYDPYLAFFRNDYLYIDSPRRELFQLILSTTLRYLINTVLSLGIIYTLFKELTMIKFAAILYGIAYIFFIALFLYFVVNPKQEDYYLFFNIRRFLIQPLLLLLLIPAFYYHKKRASL